MPRKIGGKETAYGRTDDRGDEPGSGNPCNGIHQVAFVTVLQHCQPPHRYHHRSRNALQEAHDGKLHQTTAQRAQDGRADKPQHGISEHRTRAVPVGYPSAYRNEHCKRNHVRRNAYAHPSALHAKIGCHLRQGGHQGGGINILHEESHCNKCNDDM